MYGPISANTSPFVFLLFQMSIHQPYIVNPKSQTNSADISRTTAR